VITHSNVKIGKYPNGKVVESFFPKITTNEVRRKWLAKSIEAENIRMAKRLVSQRPIVPDSLASSRDFSWHQKVKRHI